MEHDSGPLTYHGTGGSSVQVTANFLRLRVKDSTEVSEYEVQFSPQVKHFCFIFTIFSKINYF